MHKLSTVAGCILLAVLTPVSKAQFKLGDLSTDLTGTLSGGYTADYGNLTASDHGLTGGGAASLTGSYYNPNFFSFDIDPFYNQSRTNSDFQSITDASGVNASASIFGGSNFPGTIGFADIYNGEGNFNVPGVGNYTSHGDSQVFNIGWSEHVPNAPVLSVGYQQGLNTYSIYGADTNSTSDFRSFVANASYSVLGFALSGGYHYSLSNSQLPQLFADEAAETTDSDTTSYSFGLSHRLPWQGSFTANAIRTDLDYNSTDSQYKGDLDTVYSGLIFNPLPGFAFGANGQYADNLTGELYQAIAATGGIASENTPSASTHALNLTAFATYLVPAIHMTFNVNDQRQEQYFDGQAIDSDALTSTATYSNLLLHGNFNATLGVVRSSISTDDSSRFGLIGSANYTRTIGVWTFSGLANYAQDQQTLLASYLTNSMGYSGTIGRRLPRRMIWSATAGGTKAGLADQQGTTSLSESYSTSLLYRWITGTATYSRSSGNAILTSSGLVATPVPLPVVTPTGVVLYGGHAYSFGVGGTPIRGLSLSASYSEAISNTSESSVNSYNNTSQVTATLVYRIRKTFLQAGYARLVQGFGSTGVPQSMLGSFYVGISRWFSFF